MRRYILAIFVVGLVSFSSSLSVNTAKTWAAEKAVSARRALDVTLPELRFDKTPMSDAIDFLHDVSGANIHVNWKAIEVIGIDKDTPVNVRLKSVQLRKVLNLVLAEASHDNALTYYIDENVIEITTKELADKDMITKVYPVDDLLTTVPDFDQQAPQFQVQQTRTGRGGGGGGGSMFGGNLGQTQNNQQMTKAQLAQQLVDIITSTIQPQIWNTAGGPAAIRIFNGSLIVTAPRSVHEALAAQAN